MFDLLKLLTDNSPSLTRDMEAWFEKYRADAAWNVYSDYCVGNIDKANDSFSSSSRSNMTLMRISQNILRT